MHGSFRTVPPNNARYFEQQMTGDLFQLSSTVPIASSDSNLTCFTSDISVSLLGYCLAHQTSPAPVKADPSQIGLVEYSKNTTNFPIRAVIYCEGCHGAPRHLYNCTSIVPKIDTITSLYGYGELRSRSAVITRAHNNNYRADFTGLH